MKAKQRQTKKGFQVPLVCPLPFQQKTNVNFLIFNKKLLFNNGTSLCYTVSVMSVDSRILIPDN